MNTMPMTITRMPSTWVIQLVLRAGDQAAQLPERPAEEHEDHGEAQDEEPDSGQHAAAPLLLKVDAGQSGHVAEVTGHERKDAGREEGDESGQERDGDGQQERAVQDGFGEGAVHGAGRATRPRRRR